jgi:hypothetical protein
MSAADAFLELSERQIAAPRKARMRAVEKRAASKTAAEKALDARNTQARAWYAWRRERRDALLSGPHGQAATELREFLSGMTLASGAELITLVRRGPWRNADDNTRFTVLALIDDEIIKLRERSNLAPFDDSLPFGDAPPTAFHVLREVLR